MDVVYNHTYSLDSWLRRRCRGISTWWEDGSVSNGSACGNDVASEQAMCQTHFESVLYQWKSTIWMDSLDTDGTSGCGADEQDSERNWMRYGTGKSWFGEPWRG